MSLSIAVSLIALAAWGQGVSWRFERLSPYQLFPLFGLLAFSLMWSMYVVGAAQKVLKADGKKLAGYFKITGYFVLLAILLHPGLLVFRLWQDGFGLPPFSYLNHYVSSGLEWAALVGTTAFLIFIAYEFRRWIKDSRIKKWLLYASDAAILGILLHSLTLGGELQSGWLKYVWWFYGLVLVVCLFYLRILPWLHKDKSAKV